MINLVMLEWVKALEEAGMNMDDIFSQFGDIFGGLSEVALVEAGRVLEWLKVPTLG